MSKHSTTKARPMVGAKMRPGNVLHVGDRSGAGHCAVYTFATEGAIFNVRLSDPEAKDAVSAAADSVTKSKKNALEFLKGIGVATASGRLTKRHGG